MKLDFLRVNSGTPKQEHFIAAHLEQIERAPRWN